MRKLIRKASIAVGALAISAVGFMGASAPAHAGTITNLPGQPGITDYESSGTNAVPYEHNGALIITEQEALGSQPMKDASAAGATVLGYLDSFVKNNNGTYATMLYSTSACGPAVPAWGSYSTAYGPLADFRTTADGGNGIEQSKLKCVLEQMVADNPYMGGFFADDLGSMSWYPNIPWGSVPEADKVAWRDGAIALAQTFHDVAVEHGLMFMVNGTWGAGTLDGNGGGYPVMSTPGLSLADGGYIEHHATSELSYWTAYAQGQWGTAAGDVSQGHPIMYVQAPDQATMNTYNNAGVFSFLSYQTDYSQPAPVWGPFHATGLPTGSGGTVAQAPAVTTTAASGVTSSGATINGTVNPEGQSTTYQFQYGTSTSYGSVAPASPGSAGSGTSAVNESAAITGLTAGTTYHYRLTATNATGTTYGADQSFTAAAAVNVAYDATGPSSAGVKCANCSSVSWTHTVGSGSNRALVVGVSVGTSSGGDTNCFITMKDGTTTIPFKGLKHTDNQTAGFEAIYAMTNPPSGANSLSAVVSSCAGGTPKEVTAGSESFTGVNQTTPFGSPVFNAGYSTADSVSVPSSNNSDMIAGFAAGGSAISSSANTSRFIANEDGFSGAGNSAGSTAASTGGNVSMSWTVVNDWWAADAIELLHA